MLWSKQGLENKNGKTGRETRYLAVNRLFKGNWYYQIKD